MSRRSRKKAIPSPYKSFLEYQVHSEDMSAHEYEPDWAHMKYTIEKTYTPDMGSYDNPTVVYEIKGYFRTHDEAVKYIWVRKANPHITIRFIIPDPGKRAYPQTRMKMGDWLTKHKFEWCLVDQIPEGWKS